MEEADGVLTEQIEGGNLTAKLRVDPAYGKPEWEITFEMPGGNPEVWSYSGYIGSDFWTDLEDFFKQYVVSEDLIKEIRDALEKMKKQLEEAA